MAGGGVRLEAVIWTHVCNLRVPGSKAPVQSRKQTSPVLGQSPGRLPLTDPARAAAACLTALDPSLTQVAAASLPSQALHVPEKLKSHYQKM